MTDRTPKRPRDPNQLARLVVDLATGEKSDINQEGDSGNNRPSVDFARMGGLKGGKARAAKLSPKHRSEIARAAALTRWGKDASDKSDDDSDGGDD